MTMQANPEIVLAEPRGFCAGVDRAIDIVEHALQKFGAPIYVRHEIVHNTHVVEDLRSRGAIFIEDLNDVPPDATIGLRASALRVQGRPGDIALPGTVELAEISGSDTFVHVHTAAGELVAQLTGVHFFDLGAAITLHLDPAQVHVFGADGRLLRAPERGGQR